MKKYLLAIIPLLLLVASCEKEPEKANPNNEDSSTTTPTPTNKTNSLKGVTFKKMDISGAQALALASAKSKTKMATKGDGDGGQADEEIDDGPREPTILYIMGEDGLLSEVKYTLEVEGEGEVVEMVSANLKIAMDCVYTIGKKWLWLYDCYYYYPDMESIEDYNVLKAIREVISEFNRNRHDFLVRKTDGGLFAWDDVSNPVFGDVNWIEDYPYIQQELPCKVDQVGEDIVTAILPDNDGRFGWKLYGIFDNGDVLDVKQLLNNSVYCSNFFIPIPGQDAILFVPNHVGDWVVLFTKTAKMSLISSSFADNEDKKCKILIDGDVVYGVRLQDEASDFMATDYSVFSSNAGYSVPMCLDQYHNTMFCNIVVDKSETLYIKNGDSICGVSASNDDPNSYVLSTGSDGITLSSGSYDFVYDAKTNILYVDNVDARTHSIGPIVTLHPLSVDLGTHKASWGEPYLSFTGLFSYRCMTNVVVDTYMAQNHILKWVRTSPTGPKGNTIYAGSLDTQSRKITYEVRDLPDYFPKDWNMYYDGVGYAMYDNQSFYACSTETWVAERVPIDYSALEVDLVGNYEFYFYDMELAYVARAMTLEGTQVTIYVDVTGEKRGIARVYTKEASGAGETISQLIKLN